jgi:shikimate kinase
MLSEETGRTPDVPPERKLRRHIVFIGFMGAGKSRVGAIVAQLLGTEFVDTDDLIEQRAGRSISEIFSESGEEEFRRLETEVIASVLSADQCVIALGGGATTRGDNWDLLERADAFTIYLQASIETIVNRVGRNSHRPLLAGLTREQMQHKVENMLREREPWYMRARMTIPTDDDRSKTAMGDLVLGMLPPVVLS